MADAQLIASLKLDDSNFKKGMSDAERSAKQFEADVNKAASSADNFEKELTQVGNSAKSSAIDIKESSTAAYDLGHILGTSIKAGAAIAITITIAIRHRPMIACGLLSSLCIIFFPHHPWTKQTVDYVCHEICDDKNCCNDDYTGRNCNRICCNHTVHQISSDSLD